MCRIQVAGFCGLRSTGVLAQKWVLCVASLGDTRAVTNAIVCTTSLTTSRYPPRSPVPEERVPVIGILSALLAVKLQRLAERSAAQQRHEGIAVAVELASRLQALRG